MKTSEIMSSMIFGDGGASKVEELSTDGGSTDAGKVLVVGDNGKIAASDLTVGEGAVAVDKTFKVTGAAADSKAVGDAIDSLNGSLSTLSTLSAFMNTVPVDTASGAIATFADGADDIPVKSLVVNIDPVQSGSGDPSPDNVRPISGWTGINLTCNNKNINIDWTDEAGTVYGGSLDVSTGVLTVTHTIKSFTSRIALHPNFPNAFYINSAFSDCGEGIPLCNMFSYRNEALHKMSLGKFSIDTNYTRLCFRTSAFSDATEANAFFAENPLIVAYPLATFVTYQLTPQEVKTILGENNIYADTGDVSVEYRADIKKYIDKVVATAVSALS